MVRLLALALTFLTGFSGLVYEVVWQKYFATLLGSHSEATAAVLGIFLGGLALGYALFGAITRRSVERSSREGRPDRLLLVYGAVEGGIGAYALAFPLLFRAGAALSGWISVGGGALGFVLDVLLTMLLIGPPTILMGATIPLLTQSLTRSLTDATRLHALVYASNTIGAFAGALLAGFVLVPRLGLDVSMLWMGCINLVAGGTFAWIGRRPAFRASVRTLRADSPVETVAGFAWFAVAALLAGFAMMTIQTVLIRLGALTFGASQLTFSMVVAVFVLCIAVGSFGVSALPRVPRGMVVVTQVALVALLAALYPLLQDAPYFAHALRMLFVAEGAAFYPYFLTAFVAILGVLAIPIGLSGALLPLVFHELRREVRDLGSVAGRLYSWNTVGSLLGALVGGYLAFFVLDLHHVYRLAVVALAVGVLLLAHRLVRPVSLVVTILVLAPVVGLLVAAKPWDARRLASGLFRERQPLKEGLSFAGPEAFFARYRQDRRILFHDDDPTSTVTVLSGEQGGAHTLSLMTNGKPDTSVPTEVMTVTGLALIPCLLAERCESVFVVGLGTGVTAGELTRLDETRRVVVSEISTGVRRAVSLFAAANHDVEHSPEVELRHGDAYRSLLRDRAQYDAIISEPSNPWVAGVENLYSREFLAAARDRLRPGGVYAQWFHLYESSDELVQTILRTFTSVFGSVSVWYGMGVDVILIGWNGESDAALDLERLMRRASRPDFASGFRRGGWETVAGIFAHEIAPYGMVNAAIEPGPVQSLFHPIVSYEAAREFFAGTSSNIAPPPKLETATIGRRNSLLRRQLERPEGGVSDEEWIDVVQHACVHRPSACAPLIAWWAARDPQSTVQQELTRSLVQLGKVTESDLQLLSILYAEPSATDPVPSAIVERLVDAFLRLYHPAAPFQRRALASALQRCTEPGTRRCELLQRAAAERLGRLDIEAAVTAPAAVRDANH